MCDMSVPVQIMAQILWGPPPWEHPKTAPAFLRKLGHFQGPVLKCLNRNPLMRPSMAEFKRACNMVICNSPSSIRSSVAGGYSQAGGFPQSGGYSVSQAGGYPGTEVGGHSGSQAGGFPQSGEYPGSQVSGFPQSGGFSGSKAGAHSGSQVGGFPLSGGSPARGYSGSPGFERSPTGGFSQLGGFPFSAAVSQPSGVLSPPSTMPSQPASLWSLGTYLQNQQG